METEIKYFTKSEIQKFKQIAEAKICVILSELAEQTDLEIGSVELLRTGIPTSDGRVYYSMHPDITYDISIKLVI